VPILTPDLLTEPWRDMVPVSRPTIDAGQRVSNTAPYEVYNAGTNPFGTIGYDGGTGEFSFSFDISNSTTYPAGYYYIRVQCFRKNEIQHYSYHQIRIEVKRP
jgi:hypothetical protein